MLYTGTRDRPMLPAFFTAFAKFMPCYRKFLLFAPKDEIEELSAELPHIPNLQLQPIVVAAEIAKWHTKDPRCAACRTCPLCAPSWLSVGSRWVTMGQKCVFPTMILDLPPLAGGC